MARAKYPVKRGNRYDRLCIDLVLDWAVEGMEELDGGKEDDELIHRTMDYAVMAMSGNAVIYKYARIVIYSGVNGNGGRVKLKTTDGVTFTIPEKDASKTQLALGFINWMKMDENEQEDIDSRIIELNKPPAARHILPTEQLTEVEQADPNSKGEGVTAKKG